jgi:hypothetical protein
MFLVPLGLACLAACPRPRVDESIVRVIARDFVFTAPQKIPGGLVTIRLVNQGTEPHYLGFMRLDSAKTVADFLAWRASRTPRPAWLTPAGGIAPVVPNDSSDLTLTLPPGRYAIFCTYPGSDGQPHLMKGMVGEISVGGEPSAHADSADDARVTLRGHRFELSGTLRSGRQRVRVENTDSELHQVLVIRLPNGVTAEQEMAWFRSGSSGPRPGLPHGGILQIPPGDRVWFSKTLRAGRYLLLCTVGGSDGNPHFVQGMRSEFEIH